MCKLPIEHYKSCKATYPEKPEGEAPQATTLIPISPSKSVRQCNDCGAFVIENADNGPSTTRTAST